MNPLVRHGNFGLADHSFRRHAATVPADYQKHIDNPALYAHVAADLKSHDEIRVVAEDSTWVANVFVTYAAGGVVRLKTLYVIPLEPVPASDTMQTRFIIKQRGAQKWCVVDTAENDRNVRSGIESQSEAQKQLEEHLRALAR